GAASTVRDGEGLVQVQVAYIGADGARRGEAHLGVHVRAVHVNQTTVGVDDIGDLLDGLLVHAVRAGVGHHQAAQRVLVLFSLGLQVGHVHVPFGIGL